MDAPSAGSLLDVDGAWAAIADEFRLTSPTDTGPAALAELRDRLVATFVRHGFPDAGERVVLPADYLRFLHLAGGPRLRGNVHGEYLHGPQVVWEETQFHCESWERYRPPDSTLWVSVAHWSDKHDVVLCCDRTDPRFGIVLDCHDDHPWFNGRGRARDSADYPPSYRSYHLPAHDGDKPRFDGGDYVAASFTGYLLSLHPHPQPVSEVHIVANNQQLLSLTAGPANDGHAAVFVAFEDPTQPTPDNMRFHMYSYGGNTFALCSPSVSESIFLDLACLDITGGAQSTGATAKIAPFDMSAASQRWLVENKDPARPETVTLRNVGSGLHLDSGADPQPGDRPRLQHFTPGASQQWFIRPVKE